MNKKVDVWFQYYAVLENVSLVGSKTSSVTEESVVKYSGQTLHSVYYVFKLNIKCFEIFRLQTVDCVLNIWLSPQSHTVEFSN